MPFHHPLPHELDSFVKVLEPRCQWLLRSVANSQPVGGHLVLEERAVHLVKVRAHEDEALDRLQELFERVVDDVDQLIVPLLLLQEHDTVAMKQTQVVELEYFFGAIL